MHPDKEEVGQNDQVYTPSIALVYLSLDLQQFCSFSSVFLSHDVLQICAKLCYMHEQDLML